MEFPSSFNYPPYNNNYQMGCPYPIPSGLPNYYPPDGSFPQLSAELSANGGYEFDFGSPPTYPPVEEIAMYPATPTVSKRGRKRKKGADTGDSLSDKNLMGEVRTEQYQLDLQDPGTQEPLSGEDRQINAAYKDPFSAEATVPLPFQMGDDYGYYGPVAVWKRNERERLRVRSVNEGYELLRLALPLASHLQEKRISKVETLRLAIRYIRHMDLLLIDPNHPYECDCVLEPKGSEVQGGINGSDTD